MKTIEETTRYVNRSAYTDFRNWNANGTNRVIDNAVCRCLAQVDPAKVETIRVDRLEAPEKVRFHIVISAHE